MTQRWLPRLFVFALIWSGLGHAEAQTLFRMDIYADNEFAFLSDIDLAAFDGETYVGELGTTAQHLAHDPTTGDLLGYDANAGLLRVNPTTGLATVIGSAVTGVEALTVDTTGTPWVLVPAPSNPGNPPRKQVMALDPATGGIVTFFDLDERPYADLAAVGTRLVALELDGVMASLIEIDPSTGQALADVPIATPGIFGITSGPDHDSLIAIALRQIFSREIHEIDPSTGDATFVGDIYANDSINAGSFLADIATAPARGVVDIPTLGGIGIAALATLLALAGLLVQRRG